MVHSEDASVAGLAMVSPSRLDFVADIAVPTPESLEVFCCFRSEHHKCFYLWVYAFKPFSAKIKGNSARLVRLGLHFQVLPRLALLVIASKLLSILHPKSKCQIFERTTYSEVSGSTRLDNDAH